MSKRWYDIPLLAVALLITGALAGGRALALSPNKAISQYASTLWQTDAGLPELAVESIVETSDGYLWVGTQEGLARFDGLHFTVFDHVNTPALRSDLITALGQDARGNLWIGTSTGLAVRHTSGDFALLTTQDALPADHITAIAIDRDDNVWIGTAGGLARIVNGAVTATYATADGLFDSWVSSLAVAQDNALWIGTRNGLNRLDHGVMQRFTVADGLPGNRISFVYSAPSGELWIVTGAKMIARRIDNGFGGWWPGSVRFQEWWPQGVPKTTRIRSICEDRDGNVWVGTDSQGLFRSWQELLSHATAEQGFNDLPLEVLYEDRAGNLWIGTLGRGLIRLRDGSFTTFAHEEGLASNSAYSVLQDRAGDIWVGTFDGLSRISVDEMRRYSTADGLSNNYVSALAADSAGGLWVGLGGGMLSRLVGGRFESGPYLKPRQAASAVDAILEDRRHRLWFGMDTAGLARYADGELTYFTTTEGLPDEFVTALAEDATGAVWVGTNKGLGRVTDGGADPDPLHDAALRQTSVLTLYIDARGVLWIGTMAHGLYRYADGRLAHYTMAQGLPNETINSILTDAQDNLWLGSNRGIFRIDRRELDGAAGDSALRLNVMRFGQSDGMKSAETSAGRQPSAWRGSDGKLWFATVQGVVVIDPERFEQDALPLAVHIESVRGDDKAVDLAVPARLVPGTSRLELRYTAPDLTAAETTRFRYRLADVDEGWVEVAGERVARYTNVPSGTHRFEVQASRDHGEWNAPGAAIDLDVAPMFHQTWWFRVLCATAIAALLAYLHHLRVTWLHMRSAVAEERRRIAGEIHDSLAQGFSAISVQIEAALGRLARAPDLAVSHLKLARDVSRNSLSEARRSVWNLQAPPPTETSLRDSIVAACEQLVYGQQTELRVDTEGFPWVVSPQTENHLLRIAQEATANAIRHGRARSVRIRLTYALHKFILTVADDGCGYEQAAVAAQSLRGFGLSSMRRRAGSMRGTFMVTTAPGAGTRVEVTIPRIGLLHRLWSDFRGEAQGS